MAGMATPLSQAVFDMWLQKEGREVVRDRLQCADAGLGRAPTYDDGDAFLLQSVSFSSKPPYLELNWVSIWRDVSGKKTMWASTDPIIKMPFEPWLRPQPSFHMAKSIAFRSFALAVSKEWEAAWLHYLDLLIAGHVQATGRSDRPVADRMLIPADAWRHIAISNWTDGSAYAGEVPLFSVEISSEHQAPRSVHAKRKNLDDHTLEALSEAHPEGIPDAPDLVHLRTAERFWGDRSLRKPSVDSVRRAIRGKK
jgi:hypothetical protein